MRTVISVMALCLFSSIAFASDTASVLSCYQRAYAPAPLNFGAVEAAFLCANVNSPSDVDAVIKCATQAYSNAGLNTDAHSAAVLCSYVTK